MSSLTPTPAAANIAMNISMTVQLLKQLNQFGVSEFCVCAGARNAPFVFVLDKAQGAKVHSFFEERSAAFFALGRGQSTGRPVTVVTTSGTAAAELLPAVIESHYTGIPLVLVTADRPQRYRGTGAPQAIEQVGIFSHYANMQLDIAKPADLVALKDWNGQGPIHINICFEEPLIDAEVPVLDLSPKTTSKATSVPTASAKFTNPSLPQPIVIVGALSVEQRPAVVEFLARTGLPTYAEAISGLRGETRLQKLFITSGERAVTEAFKHNWAASVIRIGSVPTLRFWRDLEDKLSNLPVQIYNDAKFTGLSRKVNEILPMAALRELSVENAFAKNILQNDLVRVAKLNALIEKFPAAEPSLFRALSRKTGGQSVYLGNSLPIREWDAFGDPAQACERVFANRGANGIDGQISTFLGWASSKNQNWCVVGDLTAMYDLASLWADRYLENTPCRIVIVNNNGGQIFKNMFNHDAFLNRHKIEFSHWAKMWNWEHQRWTEIPDQLDFASTKSIIEICPDELQTRSFWQEYQKL